MDEIAAVFLEAAPHLCSQNPTPPSTPPCTPRSTRGAAGAGGPATCGPSPGAGRLRNRLRACAPAAVHSAFVSGGDVFGTGTSAGGGSALGREVQVDTIKTCVESAYGLSA